MKRKIKFRGKRINDNSNSIFGEWVYGYYVLDPTGKSRIYWQPFSEARSNTYHFVFTESVGQFTGLKDKNGKEIYEGDKCLCRMNGYETHIEEVETEVIYDLTVGAFGYKVTTEKSNYSFFGLNSKNLLSCEIIGNIYENTDLIILQK